MSTNIFFDDFGGTYPSTNWIEDSGANDLNISSGELRNDVTGEVFATHTGTTMPAINGKENYAVEVRIRVSAATNNFSGLIARYTGTSDYYYVKVDWAGNKIELRKKTTAGGDELIQSVNKTVFFLSAGNYYYMKFIVKDTNLKVFLSKITNLVLPVYDEPPLFDVTDTSLATGKPGVWGNANAANELYWDNFSVDVTELYVDFASGLDTNNGRTPANAKKHIQDTIYSFTPFGTYQSTPLGIDIILRRNQIHDTLYSRFENEHTSWRSTFLTWAPIGQRYLPLKLKSDNDTIGRWTADAGNAIPAQLNFYRSYGDVGDNLSPYIGHFKNQVLDGFMERTGTTDWTAGNSATLSKDTVEKTSGSQSLKVVAGASAGWAEQSGDSVNNSGNFFVGGYGFRFRKWEFSCRYKGANCRIIIEDTSSNVIWDSGNLNSAGWSIATFTVEFPRPGKIKLYANAASAISYYDDVIIAYDKTTERLSAFLAGNHVYFDDVRFYYDLSNLSWAEYTSIIGPNLGDYTGIQAIAYQFKACRFTSNPSMYDGGWETLIFSRYGDDDMTLFDTCNIDNNTSNSGEVFWGQFRNVKLKKCTIENVAEVLNAGGNFIWEDCKIGTVNKKVAQPIGVSGGFETFGYLRVYSKGCEYHYTGAAIVNDSMLTTDMINAQPPNDNYIILEDYGDQGATVKGTRWGYRRLGNVKYNTDYTYKSQNSWRAEGNVNTNTTEPLLIIEYPGLRLNNPQDIEIRVMPREGWTTLPTTYIDGTTISGLWFEIEYYNSALNADVIKRYSYQETQQPLAENVWTPIKISSSNYTFNAPGFVSTIRVYLSTGEAGKYVYVDGVPKVSNVNFQPDLVGW
ncbi:MAG: hypothetical protein ACE5HR_00195 [bacterium]